MVARILGGALLALGLLAGPMHPWVPNRTDLGDPLEWDAADLPLSFVIQDAGSDDLPDGSHGYAIRRAFDAWGTQPGSSFNVLEDTDPASTARTDWAADDIHLVLFDETDASGFFAPGSGLVALTAYEFDTGSGQLLDGDILLNGFEQTFATDLADDAYDVRATVTHEVGHLTGLAHSALGGATMAPFVGKGRFQKRSLAADDVAAVELLYPGSTKGRLTGLVTHNGLPVPGAHVYCMGGNGLLATSTLSAADGSFSLGGLEPNDYRVVAAPLDSPITPELLGAAGLGMVDTFFRQSSVSVFSIVAAESKNVGTLAVGDDSALTILSPVNVQVIERNQTVALALEVAGVVGGTPSVTVSSSGSISVQNVDFDGGSSLGFELVVPIGTPPGLYDLEITTTIGTTVSHAGFLEVVPAAPTISAFIPQCGGGIGGQEVFLGGTNLATVVEFVFGDAAGTITAVGIGGGSVAGFPPLHATGLADVVVVTAVGNEARVVDGYTFIDGGIPVIDTVFPPAGDENGGTTVLLTGSGFGLDTAVFFDFVQAASVTVIDDGTLSVVTPALANGSHDVTVIQAGCSSDLFDSVPDAFAAVTGADPTVDLVAPALVSQAGGEAITVTGTQFVNGAVVQMFADPLTGLGGTDLSTTFVSPTQLDAVTPVGPLLGGLTTVSVRLPTDQVGLLEDALEVDAPEVLSVTPILFAQSGGVTLTVLGAGFVPGGVVELFTDLDDFTGGTPLATTFVSPTELSADVPTSLAPLPAGPANVAVTFQGPLFGGKPNAVTIVAPSLDAVVPDEVSPAGAQTLTLTGFGFTPGAVVRLFADPGDLSGGTVLSSSVLSGTEIEATTPDGPITVGVATLAVDLPGALVVGLVDGLEVLPPRIDALTPLEFDPTGGETVTVTGFGFTAQAALRMFVDPGDLTGGTALATTFVSVTELTAVVPDGPLVVGDVAFALDQPNGPSVGFVGSAEVLPPRIDAIAPTELDPTGDELLTITGFGFDDQAVLRMFVDPGDLGGGSELVTSFVSSSTLTAVTPGGPLAAGAVAFALDQPNSPTVGLVGEVTVLPPSLDAVSPSELDPSGGETLTLTGFGFTDQVVVRLFADPGDLTGGTQLVSTFVSDTEVTAVTPAGPLVPGFATLAIDQPPSPTVGLMDAVEVLSPRLDSVSPDQVSPSGGEPITLIGFGFTDGAVARMFADPLDLTGGTELVTTFVSSTELTAVTPPGPLTEGLATIAIDQAGVPTIGLVDAVDVLFPTLVAVEPTIADFEGGETITLTGTSFNQAAVVELFTDEITLTGGTALVTTFVSATTLTAVTPEGPLPLGSANVAVRFPGDVVVLLEDGIDFAALVENGNKASGDLGDGDDEDIVVFDGIAGSAVSGTLARVGKADLVPKLVLLGEDGGVLISSDEADPEYDPDFVKWSERSASLRKFVLPSTERYVLRLSRISGEGAYRFVYKEKLPPEARKLKITKQDAVVLGPGTHELAFDAKADTLLSGTLKGSKKDGLRLVLETLEDGQATLLLSTDDAGVVSGDPDLVELLTVGKELISLKFKQVTLPTFGSYRLVLEAADGTSGSLTGSLSFKQAKVKASFEGL